MDKTSKDTSAATKPTGPDLAHYQEQWERIHNKTIREIKAVRELEARAAELKAKRNQQARK
ncbi:hypothetical protein BJX99DRAFT_263830 [Aspergillus californicus]